MIHVARQEVHIAFINISDSEKSRQRIDRDAIVA
jgi:hypothetical protein